MRKLKYTTFLLFIPLLIGCVNTQSQNSTNSSSSSVHTHTYSDKMLYDDTHHWYEVTCGHDEAANKIAHSYGDWYEVEAPTCEANGSKRRDCTICDYYEIKIIEATHSYSDDYYIDENCHWSDITCEHSDAPSNKENHNYVNGICTVCQYTKQTNDYITFTLSDDGTYYIVSLCNAEATNIVIPHFYNNLPVKEIGDFAFTNCNKLERIFIPNSTIILGSYSFSDCTSLKNITFESNSQLTTIKGSAFYNCNSLTSITIPNSVTSIGDNALCGCRSLTSITIPNSVTSIGDNAFSGCSSLTSITIPNSVTSIGDNALYGCRSLTSITIPFVGQYADGSGATHFGYIFGADNYDSIKNCVPSSLKEVIITGGTNIGNLAFYDCGSLTSITIPNSVTTIRHSAFYGCSSLTSITLSNSLTSIGAWTFCDCSSLTSITIPNSVTSIRDNAFSGCRSLTIYCEVSSKPSGWDSTWNSDNRPVYWGTNENAFIEKDRMQYVIENGEAKVTKYVGNDSEVVIPSTIEINGTTYNVTSIGDYAFNYCYSLTSITIPNSVKSIGNNALYRCSSLTSITLPNSVTSIGSNAFSGCSSLTSITIPNSVTSIGEDAFSGCSRLAIYCELESKPEGWSIFWNLYRPVYWAGEWEYDADGNPTPII